MFEEKKDEYNDFATKSILILRKYTEILKDYNGAESLKPIRKLIIKLRSTIDINAYSVKYYMLLFLQ